MPDTLVILRAQQLGVSVAVVTLLWAALHVVRSTSSFLGGAWTDRLGAERTMWIGGVCYALLAAGMAYAHTTLQAWGLFLALGVVAGLTESPERALVARTPGARQGSGFGAYHGLTGFAALAGGLVLGGVFQAYGGAAAFVAGGVAGRGAGVAGAMIARRGGGPCKGEA